MRPPRTGTLLLCTFAFIAGGCRRGSPAPAIAPVAPPTAYVPRDGSNNAFDAYALAALDVQEAAGKDLDRVAFFPKQKNRVRALCARPVLRVRSATRSDCRFEFTPRPPLVPAQYQRGWRLIGRSLRWDIEDAVAKDDYSAAIETALVATRFGFDLTGGGATDASLGLAIVDDARIALLPALDRMGAGQLGRLREGLADALKRKPPVSVPVEHEGERIPLAIQAVRDAFERNELPKLESDLGNDVHDAVQYLTDMRGKDDRVREYFERFAAEGTWSAQNLARLATMSAAQRAEDKVKQPSGERPWKRFARHFFTTARPLLDLDERTLARTRIFALTAGFRQDRKLGKSLPRDLGGLPPELSQDPYDHLPLRLSDDGVDFVVYSVGANLRDDGGDTDDAWLSPDLTFEHAP